MRQHGNKRTGPRRKRAKLPALLAAALLLQAGWLTEQAHGAYGSDKDYGGHWSEPLIASGLHDGLLQGYEDGSFRPEQPITRAELAVLLVRAYPDLSGSEAAAAIPDAANETWFGGAAAKAAAAGVLPLDENGLFQPSQAVTRLEWAAALAELLHWEEQDRTVHFKDQYFYPSGKLRSWLLKAVADGYLDESADGYALPYRPVTRSEALYTLTKARGVLPAGLLAPGIRAEQEYSGIILETPTGFAIRVQSGSGGFTDYELGTGAAASLAGSDSVIGLSGTEIRITAVAGLVPGRLQVLALEVSSASPAAGKADKSSELHHGQSDGVQRVEGVLIEEHHSKLEDPKKHVLKCLLMPDCAASGFGISVLQADGTYKFYKFDQTGHQLAAVLIDSITKQNNIVIAAEGSLEGDAFHATKLWQEPDSAAKKDDEQHHATGDSGHHHE